MGPGLCTPAYPGQGCAARVLGTQRQELLPWPQEGPQLLPKVLVLPFLGSRDTKRGSPVLVASQAGSRSR